MRQQHPDFWIAVNAKVPRVGVADLSTLGDGRYSGHPVLEAPIWVHPIDSSDCIIWSNHECRLFVEVRVTDGFGG